MRESYGKSESGCKRSNLPHNDYGNTHTRHRCPPYHYPVHCLPHPHPKHAKHRRGQFAGTDAYLYYWQAQLVSEHGKLPARDMHRWLPLGRDLSQTLNLYSYALAYAHKAIAAVFPKISLYHIAFYAPPVCFSIGLGVLCMFLARTFGLLSTGIVGVFLATLPGSIERSSAGFSDRDSWCLLLGDRLPTQTADFAGIRAIWFSVFCCFDRISRDAEIAPTEELNGSAYFPLTYFKNVLYSQIVANEAEKIRAQNVVAQTRVG